MAYIKSIEISEQLKNYKFNIEKISVSNISKVNLLIGSNNSGKSRFLRNVFLDKELKFNKGTKEISDYNNFVERLNGEICEAFKNTNIISVGNIQKENSLSKIDYLKENDNNIELFYRLIDNLKNVKESDGSTSISASIHYSTSEICRKLNSIPDRYISEFDEKGFKEILFKKIFKRIYIPVLRGLRKIGEVDDILRERTVIDYFHGSKDIDVFTGQNLYNEVLGLLCGDFKDRNHLKEFETFLGQNFFDGKEISLIPKVGSKVLFVKIGEEREYPIYNLGDGIQSIIILTFNLFSNQGKDVLFFIEEPELYLHPGLQRKVIETFLNKNFDTFQYFMTSHSNHLLDLTLDIRDISVFKFYKEIDNSDDVEKDAKFIIENVNNDDTSVLELLGVNNSAIFLSNCTIWLEGITDRLYIRKYLQIYQNEKIKTGEIEKIYSEDVHYSFLEYSGGNITHWDFLDDSQGELSPMKHKTICNKIFIIADNDGYDVKEGNKAERLKALHTYFQERFYCLRAKEIENILSPHIVKGVVSKLRDSRVNDSDKDGILFGETEFTLEDYRNENLGKFIDDKIIEKINDKKSNNESYSYTKRKEFKKGNTINRKVTFCKYAIEEIKTINDMSKDAIELCDKIYNFIKSSN